MAKASVQDLKGTRSLKGLLTGDAKATFNQAALDIGIRNIDIAQSNLFLLNVNEIVNLLKFVIDVIEEK